MADRRHAHIQRQDRRAGIIAATIANVNRGKGKRAYTPEDFMPKDTATSARRTKQPWQQILATVRTIGTVYQAIHKQKP